MLQEEIKWEIYKLIAMDKKKPVRVGIGKLQKKHFSYGWKGGDTFAGFICRHVIRFGNEVAGASTCLLSGESLKQACRFIVGKAAFVYTRSGAWPDYEKWE